MCSSPRARRKTTRFLVAVMAALAGPAFLNLGLSAAAAAGPGCTDSWTASGGGSWTTPGSWSKGSVPTSNDDACIGDTAGGSYTVTLNGSVAVHSVTVGGSLGGLQTLLVQGGPGGDGVLQLGGPSAIGPGGTMKLTSTDSSAAASVMGSSTLANAGTISTVQGGGGVRYLNVPIANSGSVAISSSDTRQDAPVQSVNSGSFRVDLGSTYAVAGGASFATAGGNLTVNGSFTQTGGTFAAGGGGLDGLHPPLLTGVTMTDSAGTGTIVMEGSGTLTGTIPAGQTLSVLASGGSSSLDLGGGRVTNNGVLTLSAAAAAATSLVDGTLDNRGTVRTLQGGGGSRFLDAAIVNEAGSSLDLASSDTRMGDGARVTNDGSLVLEVGAHLALSAGASLLDGPDAATSLAIDAVNGASSITGGTIVNGGTLVVPTIGTPAVGTSYVAIGGAARSGTFGAVVGQGTTYWISYTPSDVVLSVATPPTLAVSPASPQLYGTSLSMTAMIAPPGATGTVQFLADGTKPLGAPAAVVGGTATATVGDLSVGSHQLTAVFTPGDRSLYAASSSAPVTFVIQPRRGAATRIGLAVDTGSGAPGAAVTFTAAVNPSSAAGTVVFSESPSGLPLGTAPSGSGTFVFSTTSLSPGPHAVAATFDPSDPNAFNQSVSPPVSFRVGRQAPLTASRAGVASASSTSSPTGSLTITTPYTPQSPLDLGSLSLDPSASMFSATATFQNIVISDTRSGSFSITATAQSSDLTGTSGTIGTINSQDLGITNLVPSFTTGNGIQAGQVTVFDNPPARPPVGPGASGSAGLGGGVSHVIASVTNGPGSFSMSGTLTITAPSSTPAGSYTGTITFTVG